MRRNEGRKTAGGNGGGRKCGNDRQAVAVQCRTKSKRQWWQRCRRGRVRCKTVVVGRRIAGIATVTER